MKKRYVLFVLLSILVCSSTFAATNTPNISIVLLSQQPDPVRPGDVVEIRIKIENTNQETKNNVNLELLPKYPFFAFGDIEKNVGTLRAKQEGIDAPILDFRLKVDENAPEGNHTVDIKISRDDASQVFKDFVINVKERKPVLDIVKVDTSPDNLAPGKTAKLNIYVLNGAVSLIKDILVRIELAGLPIYAHQSLTEDRIQQLNSGKQQAAEFQIIAAGDAEVKTYRVPIFIEYYDVQDVRHEINATTSIVIYDEPIVKIYVRSQDALLANQKGTITLAVANQWTNKIKFLEMHMGNSDDFTLLTANKVVYLGDLDVDDIESESYTLFPLIDIDNLALPVTLQYADAFNHKYVRSFNVSVPMFTSNQAKRYGLASRGYGIFFVFIIIVGIAGLIYYRKRK